MCTEEVFQRWWGSSKYCQVVFPQPNLEQCARDGFFAGSNWKDETMSVAELTEKVNALMSERTNIVATKREQHAALRKDIETLESHNAKIVKLLARLGTYIEDEVGAELPFTTDEELELYRSVTR